MGRRAAGRSACCLRRRTARGATDDAAVFFDATRDAHVTKSYANDPAAALRAAEETRAALAATRASLLNAFDARETQNRPRP